MMESKTSAPFGCITTYEGDIVVTVHGTDGKEYEVPATLVSQDNDEGTLAAEVKRADVLHIPGWQSSLCFYPDNDLARFNIEITSFRAA